MIITFKAFYRHVKIDLSAFYQHNQNIYQAAIKPILCRQISIQND